MNKDAITYKNFLSNIIKLFQTYLLGLSIFFIFRLVYLIRFIPKGLISNYLGDLPRAFLLGIQFDTVILCYIAALPFLLAVFFSFFTSQILQRFYSEFCRYFFLITFCRYFLILFIDQQYYTYFQSHINVLVYGFFEDDTQAVLTSIRTDHPVILIVILYLILAVITFFFSFERIWLKSIPFQFQIPLPIKVLFPVLLLFLYFYGMRGSLGSYPLSVEDSSISGSQFINLIPINGVFALKTAMKEHSDAQTDLTPSTILQNNNVQSVNELISDYYDIPLDSIKKNYTDYLFQTTPQK